MTQFTFAPIDTNTKNKKIQIGYVVWVNWGKGFLAYYDF